MKDHVPDSQATDRPDVSAPETQSDSATPTLSSDWLFRDASVVRIAHAGEIYTLRKTRSGKLILTK